MSSLLKISGQLLALQEQYNQFNLVEIGIFVLLLIILYILLSRQTGLESLVKERTHALTDEINRRIAIEESLQANQTTLEQAQAALSANEKNTAALLKMPKT